MVRLTINGREVTVENGATVLEAAETLGIAIPTLCHIKGRPSNTTCMLCRVEDLDADKLVLSCAVKAAEGMRIQTDSERVHKSRKDTLDLLLSEHVGDCEAPCMRICPAGMNIPLMIRQIKSNDFAAAIATVKKDIALPAVLGRICPAPCEKGCNRKYHDDPVSICALKRFAADIDLAQDAPYRPEPKPSTGKTVAVVGAGPAGLSAAYYIALLGHSCTVFDSGDSPGGQLRSAVPDDKLPKQVLDIEIEQIIKPGVILKTWHTLGKDMSLDDLRNTYDAVALAFGKKDSGFLDRMGIEHTDRGITVNRTTYETSIHGVFAGGNAVVEGKMAIRSAAHGKFIAYAVDQFVTGSAVTGEPKRFNSSIGKIRKEEAAEFLKERDDRGRVELEDGFAAGFAVAEAVSESQRCLHCDCRKPDTCRLRIYAEEYGADQRRYSFEERKPVEKTVQHDLVVFEQGKCIRCGICIDITKQSGERYGFTFVGRGFKVRLTVPFSESLKDGLVKTARECADNCPTGAIALKDKAQSL